MSGGFLARGVFVQGDFVRGFMSGGFLSGVFCPDTSLCDLYDIYTVPTPSCFLNGAPKRLKQLN